MEVIKGYRWRLGCTRGSLVQFSKTFYWNRAFLDLAVNNPTVRFCSPQNNPPFPNFSLLNSTNDWSHSPHHHLFSLDSCWLCSVGSSSSCFPFHSPLSLQNPFLVFFWPEPELALVSWWFMLGQVLQKLFATSTAVRCISWQTNLTEQWRSCWTVS